MAGDEYAAALTYARGRLEALSRQHHPRWVINPAHLYLEDRKDAPFVIAAECSCGWVGFIGGLESHVRDVLDRNLNLTVRRK